jgi:16S rRNA (adenine1518-N6/adenine1519-N6)-dimethyltransferase
VVTLTRPAVTRLLHEHGLRPSRALGQNFVVDPNTVRRIARLADFSPGASIVEIGAGLGSLSLALADAGAQVLAVEIDARLVPLLRTVIDERDRAAPGSIEVVEADALGLDWNGLLGGRSAGPGWGLVANLPYNIATPLVLQVLEQARMVDWLLVMVQREVGERLAASVGTKAYGSVTVQISYWATARMVGRVPPTVFLPRPRVDSVLVRIDRRPEPAVDPAVVPAARLFEVVRAGFAHRRKMLRGALVGVVDPAAFEEAGVDPRARAEELSVVDWGRLAASGTGTR